MRAKRFWILVIAVAAFAAFAVETVWAANVKMRIVVVNPSNNKTQTKSVKNYLPKEVMLKDILDDGGLSIEYDAEQGLLYAFKDDIVLAPLETVNFEIIMRDVWLVAEEELEKHRSQVRAAVEKLKDKPYYDQAVTIGQTVEQRLNEIQKTQNDETVSRQQHIAIYRDNLNTLNLLKEDIDKLEKLLVTVGGPPNLELVEQSDVNLKAPSSKTTWIVIFIVLVFVAILSATFYLTWMRQASVAENIFTR